MMSASEKYTYADRALASYDLGDGVTVVGTNTWDASDHTDFIKVLYVEYVDAPSDTSHKVSFHVEFDAAGAFAGAVAYDVKSGGVIGTPLAPESLAPVVGRHRPHF